MVVSLSSMPAWILVIHVVRGSGLCRIKQTLACKDNKGRHKNLESLVPDPIYLAKSRLVTSYAHYGRVWCRSSLYMCVAA
jgi:hypothetical protein